MSAALVVPNTPSLTATDHESFHVGIQSELPKPDPATFLYEMKVCASYGYRWSSAWQPYQQFDGANSGSFFRGDPANPVEPDTKYSVQLRRRSKQSSRCPWSEWSKASTVRTARLPEVIAAEALTLAVDAKEKAKAAMISNASAAADFRTLAADASGGGDGYLARAKGAWYSARAARAGASAVAAAEQFDDGAKAVKIAAAAAKKVSKEALGPARSRVSSSAQEARSAKLHADQAKAAVALCEASRTKPKEEQTFQAYAPETVGVALQQLRKPYYAITGAYLAGKSALASHSAAAAAGSADQEREKVLKIEAMQLAAAQAIATAGSDSSLLKALENEKRKALAQEKRKVLAMEKRKSRLGGLLTSQTTRALVAKTAGGSPPASLAASVMSAGVLPLPPTPPPPPPQAPVCAAATTLAHTCITVQADDDDASQPIAHDVYEMKVSGTSMWSRPWKPYPRFTKADGAVNFHGDDASPLKPHTEYYVQLRRRCVSALDDGIWSDWSEASTVKTERDPAVVAAEVAAAIATLQAAGASAAAVASASPPPGLLRQGSTSAPLPALWAPFAPAIAGITTPNAYFSCPNSGATAGLHMHARDQFRATCPHSRWRIISIELCVNTVKWDSYCYKKRIMSKVLHGAVNEQLVFHGTAHPIIDSICNHGFNRSYSSTAVFGHGTYFARDAKYSSDKRYAQPNSSGEQQMLLCRILAGEPCEGRQGMVQPSAKPSGVLHESMVNDVADPSIYVLSAGSDDCAYPEYRITFRRC